MGLVTKDTTRNPLSYNTRIDACLVGLLITAMMAWLSSFSSSYRHTELQSMWPSARRIGYSLHQTNCIAKKRWSSNLPWVVICHVWQVMLTFHKFQPPSKTQSDDRTRPLNTGDLIWYCMLPDQKGCYVYKTTDQVDDSWRSWTYRALQMTANDISVTLSFCVLSSHFEHVKTAGLSR